ncbi:hypothetical protein ACIQU5_17300 [Streptomyces sp. NPDC090306]|uniref:hypothetical protein n=1 Tax=Streptomyces sp. NPDC090306 TaxID=3365961 RepID=UPI00382770F9
MSVEVALSVMAAARTGLLIVCDQDDQRTGSVTRAELAAVRDSSAYTDRVRLRDVLGDHGGHDSSGSGAVPTAWSERLPRSRRRGAPTVTEGQSGTPCAPALCH